MTTDQYARLLTVATNYGSVLTTMVRSHVLRISTYGYGTLCTYVAEIFW